MNFLMNNKSVFLAKVKANYVEFKLNNNTFNHIGRKDFKWIEGVRYE